MIKTTILLTPALAAMFIAIQPASVASATNLLSCTKARAMADVHGHYNGYRVWSGVCGNPTAQYKVFFLPGRRTGTVVVNRKTNKIWVRDPNLIKVINPDKATPKPKIPGKPPVKIPPVATPGNPPTIVPSNPVPPTLMTCKKARQLVKNNGYKKVRKVECNGAVYTFTARKKKHGPKVVVKVYALSGKVSEV